MESAGKEKVLWTKEKITCAICGKKVTKLGMAAHRMAKHDDDEGERDALHELIRDMGMFE